MKNRSGYPEVDELLVRLVGEVPKILNNNLVGIYLTGSLTYGDYKPKSSDVDLVVVTKHQLTPKRLLAVENFHKQLKVDYPIFKKRVECSYVPRKMLFEVRPPIEPRPYVGEGKFYQEALYGNEWLINNYWLHRCGIALVGPEFRTLVKSIDMTEVRKACQCDLETEWLPKINNRDYLNNPHYQAYFVVNLCRIAYALKHDQLTTKTGAAFWMKQTYPQWVSLIDEAINWEYGKKMNRTTEAIELAKFVAVQISQI
jgi:predicted nucleotidyltransferase